MVLAESRNESVEATVQQIRGRPRHADAIDPSELTGSGGKAAQAGRAPQRGTIANVEAVEEEDEDEDAEGDAANGGGGGPNNRPPRPAGYADLRQSVSKRARLTLGWRLNTGGVQAHVGARSRVQGAAGQQPPQGRRAAQDDPRPLFRLSPPCARVQYIAVANKHAQTLGACDPRGDKKRWARPQKLQAVSGRHIRPLRRRSGRSQHPGTRPRRCRWPGTRSSCPGCGRRGAAGRACL